MIVIDGEQFKIDVLSVKRSADFLDKYAERLANGHLRRELIGVYFNYKLQFGPGLDRKEYARLWDKLTEPVGSMRLQCQMKTATIPLQLTFPMSATNCCGKRLKKTTGRI